MVVGQACPFSCRLLLQGLPHVHLSAPTHTTPTGDAGLVGVVAQLGTVDDGALSALLSAVQNRALATVVVADIPARQRLGALLAQHKYPAPDMLSLTMVVGYAGKAGDSPGFVGAGERAHALQRAACRCADPPLALPLPHTKAIGAMRDKGERGGGAASGGRSQRLAGPSAAATSSTPSMPAPTPPPSHAPQRLGWACPSPTGRAAAWGTPSTWCGRCTRGTAPPCCTRCWGRAWCLSSYRTRSSTRSSWRRWACGVRGVQ